LPSSDTEDMDTILLVLLALTTTVGAVELVRREVVVVRRGYERWWRLDAQAMGALYASVAAVVLWVMVATGSHPSDLAAVVLFLGVLVFLLAGQRTVQR
jgi:hypothetical protein